MGAARLLAAPTDGRSASGGWLVVARLRGEKHGSLEDQMIALAQALRRRERSADFLFSAEPAPFVRERLLAAGAGVGALEFARPLVAAATLHRLVRTLSPQVVGFHFLAGSSEPLVPAARAAGARVVLSEHMVLTSPTQRTLRRRLRARVRAHFGRLVALRLAVSNAVARSLRDIEGVPEARIRVVRNAVSLERFAGARHPAARLAARRLLGYDAQQPLVVCVGRLIREKGIDVLLHATAEARPGSPLSRAQLALVGDGPERAELTALGAALGLAGRARFFGVRDDSERFYAAADVVAMPSRAAESCSLVTLEAQAAAVPVVASRIGGVPEHLVDGEGGLLVEPGAAAPLGFALERLLDDQELRARLGHTGRRHIERSFSLARWTAEMIDTVEETI